MGEHSYSRNQYKIIPRHWSIWAGGCKVSPTNATQSPDWGSNCRLGDYRRGWPPHCKGYWRRTWSGDGWQGNNTLSKFSLDNVILLNFEQNAREALPLWYLFFPRCVLLYFLLAFISLAYVYNCLHFISTALGGYMSFLLPISSPHSPCPPSCLGLSCHPFSLFFFPSSFFSNGQVVPSVVGQERISTLGWHLLHSYTHWPYKNICPFYVHLLSPQIAGFCSILNVGPKLPPFNGSLLVLPVFSRFCYLWWFIWQSTLCYPYCWQHG